MSKYNGVDGSFIMSLIFVILAAPFVIMVILIIAKWFWLMFIPAYWHELCEFAKFTFKFLFGH